MPLLKRVFVNGLSLAMILLGISVPAQNKDWDSVAKQAGLEVIDISWRGAEWVVNTYIPDGAFSIKLKNDTSKIVTTVWWEYFLLDSVRGDGVYDHLQFKTDDKTIKPGKTVKLTKRIEYHTVPDYLKAKVRISKVQFSDGSIWIRPEK